MKKLLYLFLLAILLSACDQVIYTDSQPVKTKSLLVIPAALQGKWIDQNGDTLSVYDNYFHYPSKEFTIEEPEYLSDSAILKQYKGKYFYNRRILIGSDIFWLTYMIDPIEDGKALDLYTMDPDDIVKLAKLQEVTSKLRDVEEGESNYYLFSPKKKHYKKIIADSIFTRVIRFSKLQ